MNKEYILIIIGLIITLGLLLRFTPRDKIRKAHVGFLGKLVITWLLGLTVVEFGLIEYPARIFFREANKTSFEFEFFIYPAICAIFIVNYPEKKSNFGQFMYYVYYCTSLTVVEVIVEKYTSILNYIHWTWYITWISFFITFYINKKYNDWFFRVK